MKLRRLPQDFQVDEVSAFPVEADGLYTVYRMTKEDIGTPEALDQIQRKWKLQRKHMSYGGLKDRHAVTSQFVTIQRGPRKPLLLQKVRLEYLGCAPRPFTPAEIEGNRFQIVMRSMSDRELELALAAIPDIQRTGLPNYFDDQRFGSVTSEGEFIAVPWLKRDYERALYLTFAAHSDFDQREDREQKALLRKHWGNWPECKAALERSHRRSIVTFLADRPGDFRGAWSRVRQDMRSLYLSAFQSHLWNQLLATLLREKAPGCLLNVEQKTNTVPFFRNVPDEVWAELRDCVLPLPSGRQKPEPGLVEDLLNSVLEVHGLEFKDLRVRYPRDSFFSKGLRAAVIPLETLTYSTSPDELEPRRHKLSLAFQLPRGSYATILVKRLTVVAGGELPELVDGV
ncbi:MAG: tRNA pseudouridine(13) synthase TruD [Planctomycetaceae bacterium]|nr:tRNA pseudouridine(13) synthase TruD [Planctomycetaceae bacterium]